MSGTGTGASQAAEQQDSKGSQHALHVTRPDKQSHGGNWSMREEDSSLDLNNSEAFLTEAEVGKRGKVSLPKTHASNCTSKHVRQ
jgi:hypothetical protein